MAKKAKKSKAPSKDPSKMTIAELGAFLDGADKMLADMRNDLAVAESDVQIFRHEMSKRLGLNAAASAATRSTRKAGGKPKAAKTKASDPSEAEVNAAKSKVFEAVPASGKGKTAGDVRKELELDSRVVELAFSALYGESKIKPADDKAKGRYRAMVRA